MRLSGKEERLLDLSSRMLLQERREALSAETESASGLAGKRPVAGTARSAVSPV